MSQQPNLLFVFPDQFRAQAIGALGQDPVVTPNLDSFAAESRVLTHAVSNYPEVVAELTAVLNEWLARTGDPWGQVR